MAKFSGKNIEFKDDQKAIFGDDDDSAIYWDGVDDELIVTTVLSGIDPIDPGHLVTKRYVDSITASGTVSEVSYVEDEVESSTTSTSWTEKLSLNASSLPAGDYLMFWCYEWRYGNKSKFFRGRVQIDDTQTIMEQYESTTNTNNWSQIGGFKKISFTSGNHNIDIDYCSSRSGKTAYIRRARIELWRV